MSASSRLPSAKSQEHWDDGDAHGYQLLGAGQKLRGTTAQLEAVEVFEEHLRRLERGEQLEEEEASWQPGDMAADPPEFLRYTRATGPGTGLIDNCLYARAASKQSFWVLMSFEVSGGLEQRVEQRVAKVSHFLKASEDGKGEMRVAVTTLYQPHRVTERGNVYVVSEQHVFSKAYPVAMTSIVCTLASCVVRDPRPRDKRGARNLRWLDERDAGKVFLIRTANASRF